MSEKFQLMMESCYDSRREKNPQQNFLDTQVLWPFEGRDLHGETSKPALDDVEPNLCQHTISNCTGTVQKVRENTYLETTPFRILSYLMQKNPAPVHT